MSIAELKPVASSNVAAVGYDGVTRTLAVQFKGGAKVYHYKDVPPETYAELSKAESVGKFIGQNVVGKFEHTAIVVAKEA